MFLKGTRILPNIGSMELHTLSHSYGYSLTEGLITSYPIDKVIDILSRELYLKRLKDYNRNFSTDYLISLTTRRSEYCGTIQKIKGSNDTDRISITVAKDGYNKNKELLDKYLVPSGYFCYGIYNDSYESEDGKYAFDTFVYEKKFDNDVTNSIFKYKRELYHITLNAYVDKILRQGLKPKDSEWINDLFPAKDRIYFFLNDVTNTVFKNPEIYFFDKENKNTYNTGYTLLKIDVSKLNKNIKFYSDPRQNNSVFTYDSINPEAIKIVDTKFIK